MFALGKHDVSHRFQIPQKLYGREPELAVLLALFERVSLGGTEFCMVSGHPGIGKSALVNEISKQLVGKRGYLIQGKFDQFRRSTPYSAVAFAFRDLIQQLLAESTERQKEWCQKLTTALAPNAQLMIDLIPDLERIIGPQPAVPELPRTEDQNRFQISFLNFVRVIANEQPLVIFLDDLQFGDVSTLNMIRWLGMARDLNHLLFIGAFRSNEADICHPLRLALNELQESRAIHELPLQPLGVDAVDQLVADTLSTDAAACQPLSELLYERTLGNAFFLTETLRALERAQAIAFMRERGRWSWNMETVLRSGIATNVVELMVESLRQLPLPTQGVLQLASCIGNTFDLQVLAITHERSIAETSSLLLPALRQHVIVPLEETYKFIGEAQAVDDNILPPGGKNPAYRFQHDHVQQAAYALIPEEHKQSVHLTVGRLMHRHASLEERDQRLIDIVGHLNEGRRLIDDPVERKEVAALNLAAGIRSQRASAYETALSYLSIGLELLPADSWTTEYDLTKALATEYQQCAYLTKRYDEAESWIEQLLMQARTKLEKAEILSMRTRQYSTTGKMEASIQAAILGLSLLGIRITKSPNRTAIQREMMRVKRNLAGRRIADLISAPPLSNPSQMVAIRLLMEIFPAAFLSGSGDLFPLLVLKSVNISLRGGNSPESAFAYAAYGMLLCGALEDPAKGYEFGKLAVAMNDSFDDIALKSRVIYVYAMFVHHWSNHWSSMTQWFRKGIEAGYQSGDLLYLAYSAQDCIIWDPKLDLEAAAREHANYMRIVHDCAYEDSFDSGSLFLQMQRNFLGLTDDLCSLSDANFNECLCVENMRRRKFMTGIANYHIYKVEVCFFYGNHTEALSHVREQDKLIASAMSLPQLVRFYIASFLTLAACLPAMKYVEKLQTRKQMQAHLRRMARWAKHCPANFLHLRFLMEAELARLDGRVELALRLYERAIDSAHTNEFLRDEAMANELAARHLFAVQRRKAAEGYLRAARHLYERWGARRKVEQIGQEFAQLLTPQAPPYAAKLPGMTAPNFESGLLDVASVIKASQAISSEIVLERLWATTTRVMLENAGGQRGCFVVRKGGQLVIEGMCEVGGRIEDEEISLPIDSAGGALLLPISVVYHVLHTNNPVIINDMSRAGHFAKDAYVLARKAQSILCVPLTRQGRFEGAIYIENRLANSVFTDDRIEVIRLLAAQAFISIENAKLYSDQKSLIEAQRRFVPSEFLESLHRPDIARVEPGEYVAKTMSVLFADLRNFTPLAERLDPRTVIERLNGYFVAMEPEISQIGGFIDSFDGDRIKALFDVPADAAVHAGVGMWRALEQLNRRSAYSSEPQLQMGIGVNMGFMVLGVVGGRSRMQCSFVGDTANVASRIEQLTKVYQARLLISEQTLQGMKDQSAFATRLIDRVTVSGKTTGIGIYEVLDAETPERRAEKLATAEQLRAGMDKYFRRDFRAARREFEQIYSKSPDDVLSAIFLERCARYLRQPPPDSWDGFERLEQK
jgi:predicted ATPase/class 3 adenylate cyclase